MIKYLFQLTVLRVQFYCSGPLLRQHLIAGAHGGPKLRITKANEPKHGEEESHLTEAPPPIALLPSVDQVFGTLYCGNITHI